MTSTGPETSETPGATTQRHGFGIDVGGSGIKGGIVDLDTGQLIGDRIKLLTPQPATPLAVAKTIAENDADAAGLAETRYGAGKNNPGLVVLLTFGTGIGSAVIHNGTLIPNTEFGHLEVGGKEAEERAASSVKEKNDWTYPKWAKQVTRVLIAIENAIWPDLFIAGGGISRKADKWVPLLENRTPVVPAALQNTAGIVGAAMASVADTTH